MEPVVVYEAEIPWARQAQAVLRDSGIHSELLSLPPPVMRQEVSVSSTAIIKVAVSRNDVAAAREVLQKWAMETERAAVPLSRGIVRSFLVVAVPPIVVGTAVSILHVQVPEWLFWVGVGWVVVSIAAIAVWQRRAIESHN